MTDHTTAITAARIASACVVLDDRLHGTAPYMVSHDIAECIANLAEACECAWASLPSEMQDAYDVEWGEFLMAATEHHLHDGDDMHDNVLRRLLESACADINEATMAGILQRMIERL